MASLHNQDTLIVVVANNIAIRKRFQSEGTVNIILQVLHGHLISKILVNDPDNSQLSLRRAVLHDERIKEIKANEPLDSIALQNELALSEEAYLKTLSIAADNLVANFNLSMLYNDQANGYYLAINSMTNDEYKANAEDYEAKALALIAKALPRMEAAAKKDTTDLNILRTLESYYDRLNMGDQKRAIQEKIKQKKEN